MSIMHVDRMLVGEHNLQLSQRILRSRWLTHVKGIIGTYTPPVHRIRRDLPSSIADLKKLFSRDRRAYSHGCVQLENPRLMAAAVLGTTVDHVASQIADGRNKRQDLNRKVSVYVSYFTAWPSEDGEVKYFNDVYGRDGALAKALAKERKAREQARGA